MSPKALGPVRPVALLTVLLASMAGGAVALQPAHADECLARPTGKTPQGSHWYYHTDRVHHRKCWFLRGGNEAQQAAASNAAAPAATASQAAAEPPAAASKPPAAASKVTEPTATRTAAAAGSCLAAPKGAAPKGQHWFYHRDHATKKKCWHLGAADAPADAADAPADTADAAPAPTPAKPTAPADAADNSVASTALDAVKHESDSVWSSAPRGTQTETVSSGADSDQQSIPDLSAAAAAATADKPAAASARQNDQPAPTPSPAASASPSMSALADADAAAPSGLLASPAHADTATPVDEPAPRKVTTKRTRHASAAGASDDGTAAANNPHPAAQAAASGTTPLSVLLIVALALGLTAILYRVGLKLLAMRAPRVIVDQTGHDWGEHRYEEASTVPQQPADTPPPSIVPATAEVDFPHPTQREWPRDGLGSRIVQRQPPRDERLGELLRDLDQLLKSRKST